MQNNKNLQINTIVCIAYALLGSFSTILNYEYRKYLADEYEKNYKQQRDIIIQKEAEGLYAQAEKLTTELKSNQVLKNEAAKLMKVAQKLKGPEVYLIRVGKGTFQKEVRFVYSGVCFTITDGCRSDNDLDLMGTYPEIEKILPKLPFNSYGGSNYGLVFKEMVEGSKPKIEITVAPIK
jgi:hypothetical protein